MVFVVRKQWRIYFVFIQFVIKNAYTQVPVPVPVFPPPMMAMPLPPIQVAVAMPMVDFDSTTTTTTTTTERTVAIAIPMPVPMPVQVAIPAPPPPMFCQIKKRPPGCPPCPPCVCTPSCTPAFYSYCSPCHQKCRCRDHNDAPEPQPNYPPMPVPGPAYPVPVPMMPPPPPVLMLPFPPMERLPPKRPPQGTSSDSDCDSRSSSSSTSCESRSKRYRRRPGWRRRGKRRRSRYSRRNGPLTDFSSSGFVKPVLAYISEDGNIKLKKKLSNDEAADLLEENSLVDGRKHKRLKILTGRGRFGDYEEDDISSNRGRRLVSLRNGLTSRNLKGGKKELIFKQPPDKKLTDLSVSFKVV